MFRQFQYLQFWGDSLCSSTERTDLSNVSNDEEVKSDNTDFSLIRLSSKMTKGKLLNSNYNIPEMDKKLTRQEALKKIDQLIQQKVEETGKSYMEISREAQHRLQEKLETKEKLTKHRFKEMVSQLAKETGKTELEVARELNHYLNKVLEQDQRTT